MTNKPKKKTRRAPICFHMQFSDWFLTDTSDQMVGVLNVSVLKSRGLRVSPVVSLGLTKEIFRNYFTLICFVVDLAVTNSEFLQFLGR